MINYKGMELWYYYENEKTYYPIKPGEVAVAATTDYNLGDISYVIHCDKCCKSYGLENIFVVDDNVHMCKQCYNDVTSIKLTMWDL